MGSHKIWQPTMEALKEKYHPTALDLPGHGNTEADLESLDFDRLSQSLSGFIDTNFDRPVVLVGYSMGGRIALYTALKYPAKIRGLVLESTTAGIEDGADRQIRLEKDRAVASRLRQTNMKEFLVDWYDQPVFRSLSPELKKKIIKNKSSNDPIRLAEIIVKLSPGAQPSLWDKLGSWDKPVLIVTGKRDRKFTQIGKRMASLMSNSVLSTVAGAGHIVYLENHKEFMIALKSYLNSYIL